MGTPFYDELQDEFLDIHQPAQRVALPVEVERIPDTGSFTEYVYSDPAEDDDWPDITHYDPDDPGDEFPESWSNEPTVRDQAAIDAGNA